VNFVNAGSTEKEVIWVIKFDKTLLVGSIQQLGFFKKSCHAVTSQRDVNACQK